jgi:hypothetical protein
MLSRTSRTIRSYYLSCDTLANPLQRLYGGSAADDKGPSVLESAAMCAIAPLAFF